MSHYKPYPAYKDSGVEWLGRVPEHWCVTALKRGYLIVGGATPASESIELWDGDITWVTPADLSRLDSLEISYSQRTITDQGLASCGTSLVPVGSIVLSTRAPIGSLGIAAKSLCTNQGCKSLVPLGLHHSRFMAYLLSIATEELNLRGRGATFLELSGDALSAFDVCLPERCEQLAIANHLDRETTRIDALIEKKTRFIELLREKRQALITHAVTKGLDPNVKMKDSGVEWLGEVPEHWVVRKVVWDFSAEKGRNAQILTREYCGEHEGDFAVYSGQTENEGVMGKIDSFEFDSGEDGVLFATTVGARAMDLRQIYGKFSLSQNCMVIYPRPSGFIARFFLYHFSPLFRYERGLIPDHMQPSFRMEDLYSYSYACPPELEQRAIAEFVDENILRIDRLAGVTERSIELLKERRSALITAAVTGQIDLREAV